MIAGLLGYGIVLLARRLHCRCGFAAVLCLVALAAVTSASTAKAGTASACLAADMASWANRSELMVGAMMEDQIASAAPFDLRYVYIAGQFPDGGSPCASCAAACSVNGRSCRNDDGNDCGWWGCWQDSQNPPGAFARQLITKATAGKQLPIFTYYTFLPASGVNEGKPEIAKAADAAFMRTYYNDFRFLLRQIGTAKAIVHLEPDFWGYARQVNQDPRLIAAAVASANASDCAGLPNSIAGMGHCLIQMVRTYAPAAKVGFHASAWNTSLNSRSSFDVDGDARATAAFLALLGSADLVVVEADDRDAGYYQAVKGSNHWWDETNATLPNFNQMFQWVTTLTTSLQLPALWWQMPLGNMALANTDFGWHDNRLDYFFAHMPEVARSNSFGVVYGPGATGQTTPSTDGGLLRQRTRAYVAAGRTDMCQPLP